MATQDEIILLKIDLDSDSLVKKIKDIKRETDTLRESNKKLAAEAKKALEAGDNATYEKNTEIIIKNNVAIKNLTDQQRNHANILNLEQKANQANAGSYEQLLRQQQIAAIQLKNLEGTLKRNAEGNLVLTDTYLKQKQKVDEAKTAIIAFDQGIKDGRTNVGNYTESFAAAIDKTGIFNGQLGILRETLNGAKSGVEVLKTGVESLKQGFESFKNFAKEATAVKDSIGGIGEAGKVAGAGLEGGAAAGSKGMQLLKIAIASTGIGLLVIAIGALFVAFTKTEEGGNKLKQIFAGIGAVTDVLIGGLAKLGDFLILAFTKPKEILTGIYEFLDGTFIKAIKGYYNILIGIATLDFTQAKKGFSDVKTGAENFGKSLDTTAASFGNYIDKQKAAFELGQQIAKQQQTFEKTQEVVNAQLAENLRLSGDLRIASQDKTKSDKERLEALDEAGKLEEKNLIIERDRALQSAKIASDKLKQAQIAGIGQLEAQNELIKATTDYQNKVDAVEDKVNDIKSEGSKIRLAILKSEITATIGILDNDLKQRQLNGEQAFDLQRSIALKSRNAALADTTLSSKERLKIESDYQLKLAEIKKSESDFEKEINNSITDSSIQSISDKTTREIAAEATATQRKIEALQGNAEQIAQQKEALLLASQTKIDEIVKAADEKELADITESGKKKLEADQKIADDRLKIEQQLTEAQAQVQDLQLQNAAMFISGIADLIGQDAANRKKFALLLKQLGIAEVAINLQRELSAISLATAAQLAYAATLGPAGLGLAAAATASGVAKKVGAIIQASLAIVKISTQKFAKGGLTDSFKTGGHVKSPRVGLIGEAGAEWVAPNWMMKNRVTAPVLAGLERMRINGGVVPFANGGFTQSTIYNNIGSINVEDMMRAFSNVPAPVVIVQDINDVQGRVAKVSDRASY